MISQEFKEKSDEQLNNMLEDLDRELFLLKNELAITRKIEKPHLLKEKKKNRARILTLLSQRQKEKKNGK